MSFAPFSNLKARILADSLRTDAAFAAELPGFVTLAEQRMWYGDEGPRAASRVRVRDMDTSTQPGFVDGAAALPERFLEASALIWGEVSPQYVTPEEFWKSRPYSSNRPEMYTVEGSTLRVWPELTGSARLVYTRAYAPLVADADTNWLLVNAPGIYFHGVMFEAWRFLRNTEKMAEADGLYRRAVSGMNKTETRARMLPTTISRRSIFA